MSEDSEQLLAELAASAQLPFGIARSTAVEELVSRADELGDARLAVTSRLHLMTAYSYGGEPLRRFPVFEWLLDRDAQDPDLFDEDDRYRLLWMFKWVTVGVVEHPAVPLDRILTGLDDMERRYAAAGEGMAPVLSCRFQVQARVRGHEAAREAYLAWRDAPRTPLSDCLTCEPALQVWHLAALGEDAAALKHAFPVLERGGCADQPQKMIGHALDPLVRLGMSDRAATEHLRGIRLLRERPGSTATWAQHVQLCARTGRLHRGLDLLEHRLHEVDDAPVPEDAMWLAAAGARLLRGLEELGEGDLPVHEYAIADDGQVTHRAADLRGRLARRALDLADRFDRRNASTATGAQVKGWLDAPTLPELPIGRVLTRPRTPAPARPRFATAWQARPHPSGPGSPHTAGTGPQAARTGQGPPARGPDRGPGEHTGPLNLRLIAGDPPALLAALEDAERTGVAEQRQAVLDRWAAIAAGHSDSERPGPEHPDRERVAVARLTAALALDRAEKGLLPTGEAREAAVALNDLGQAGTALRHALSCVRIALSDLGRTHPEDLVADPDPDPDAVREALADARALLDEGDRVASEGDRACLHLGYAAVLRAAAAAGLPGTEEVLAAAVAAAHAGLAVAEHLPPSALTPVQRGCLALLRRDVAMARPVPERAAPLELALALLPAGTRTRERALVGYALGTALADADDPHQACDMLAVAADDALAAGDEELAVHTEHALGRALADSGDPEGAVHALTRAVELSGPHAGALLLAELRQGLAAALRDTGHVVEAAELADAALDELEDALGEWGIGPAPEDGPPPGPGRPGTEPAERVAGKLAFTAAQCAQQLSENDLAADMARRAAAWQRGHGIPEAEALLVAAQTARHPVEAADLYARAARVFDSGGRWWSAAACRRSRTGSVLEHRGLEEALAAADEAAEALTEVERAGDAGTTGSPEETRLVWERLALTEQTIRLLATAGHLKPAMERLEGLEEAFRQLGDASSARDVVGLHSQVLDELGYTADGLDDLARVAEEAFAAGDDRQAARLGGFLSAYLDDLGRPEESAEVWSRFAPQ